MRSPVATPSVGILVPAILAVLAAACSRSALAADVAPEIDTKRTATYARLKAFIDAVPSIDTHDHLYPFLRIPGRHKSELGEGMTLSSIWRVSYFPGINRLTPWKEGQTFDEWWKLARGDFDNARATSFYRYLLPAFRDLYGVDFDTITDAQAKDLNRRIFENYKDSKWLKHVVTERANIELMLVDPYWARLEFFPNYEYSAAVFNVTTLVRGFHSEEFTSDLDSPFAYARKAGMTMDSLDDYLLVLDRMFRDAVAADVICLKSTLAYQRTLDFQKTPKEAAAAIFGKKKRDLSAAQIKQFEDFIFWTLCDLSGRHNLPFQIHTGQARIQGSNPMLLVDLIEAHPGTKFVLFHGGFPWVGETGVILMKHGRHVWIDSCWLPTLSYTMAKRAFHEWLEVMPSDRILWGADCNQAEGIYAATEFTRQCVAEVLAEKVIRSELKEEHARRIGKQIFRDNALALFPKLTKRLWRTPATNQGG